MEPNEIFELIIKADEKIKYAKPGKGDLRAGQARELLEQARDAARAIDNDTLVEQAERRLADLETLANEAIRLTGGRPDVVTSDQPIRPPQSKYCQ